MFLDVGWDEEPTHQGSLAPQELFQRPVQKMRNRISNVKAKLFHPIIPDSNTEWWPRFPASWGGVPDSIHLPDRETM